MDPLVLRLISRCLVCMSSSLTFIRDGLPMKLAARNIFSLHLFRMGNKGLKSEGVICEGSALPFIVKEFIMSCVFNRSLFIEYDAHIVSNCRVDWGISKWKLANVAP